ncbi:MAG TPA: hypothetical protein GXX25_01785 [Desulfotomaculum sp.]|nr:hypothetical protein [Desulfotomaculum sp.]
MHQIHQQIQRLRDEVNGIMQMASQLQQSEQSNSAQLQQLQQREINASQQLQRISFMAGRLNQEINQLSSLAQQLSTTMGQTQFGGQFGQAGWSGGVSQPGFTGYAQAYQPGYQTSQQFGGARYDISGTTAGYTSGQFGTQYQPGNIQGYAGQWGNTGQFGGNQPGQWGGQFSGTQTGQWGTQLSGQAGLGGQLSGQSGQWGSQMALSPGQFGGQFSQGGFRGSISDQGQYTPNYSLGTIPNTF